MVTHTARGATESGPRELVDGPASGQPDAWPVDGSASRQPDAELVDGPASRQPDAWPVAGGPLTRAADTAVLRSWRAGAEPFHIVAVRLAGPELEHRRRAVSRALHPWCSDTTPGQAHVTLAVLGADCRCAELAACLPEAPVAVAVGGADSFDAAVFLHAGGRELHGLRGRILARIGAEFDPADSWVPHVTVGVYRWAMPTTLVAARLQPWRRLPALLCRGQVSVLHVDRGSRAGRLLPHRCA